MVSVRCFAMVLVRCWAIWRSILVAEMFIFRKRAYLRHVSVGESMCKKTGCGGRVGDQRSYMASTVSVWWGVLIEDANAAVA